MKPLLWILCLAVFAGCKKEVPEPTREQLIQAQVEKELLPKMVGARKLLEFKAEKSLYADGRYLLTFVVEGVNKFNGPVREPFAAQAVPSGFEKWRFEEVEGAGRTVPDQISR